MGLKSSPGGGLRLLLEGGDRGGRIATESLQQRLSGDLPAALGFVLQADEASSRALVTADGAVDYAAVAAHVCEAVAAAQARCADEDAAPAAIEPVPAEQRDGSTQEAGPSAGAPPAAGTPAPTTPAPGASSRTAGAAGANGSDSSSGRLGPRDVFLAEMRGSCDIQDGHLLSRANFSTLRGNVCVFKGRWMYEVQLGSRGIMQLGWTTLGARFTSEEGIGDSRDSYAYDGKRRRRWNVEAVAYGESWAVGDVIGCCIDMDAGTISYTRNGVDLVCVGGVGGVAFRGVRRMMPGMAYFPGISLSYSESCWVNFGARPFAYPAPGYRPLQQRLRSGGEPRPRTAAAAYLAGCLSRLLEVTGPGAATSPATAAALVAVRSLPLGSHLRPAPFAAHMPEWVAPGGFTQSQLGALRCQILSFKLLSKLLRNREEQQKDDRQQALERQPQGEEEEQQQGEEEQQQQEQQKGEKQQQARERGEQRRRRQHEAASLEGSLRPELLSGCHPPPLPPAAAPTSPTGGPRLDAAAVEAAAAGLDVASGSKPAVVEVGAGRPAIDEADCLLLASVLVSRLGPMCLEPYLVEAAVLPLLRDTWGRGAARDRERLSRLADWLAAAAEPEELQGLVSTAAEALGRQVRGCVWAREQLPHSAAAAGLELWGALLVQPALRRRWVAGPDWMRQLEALLSVRQPTSGDLGQLFPNIEWNESDRQFVLRAAMDPTSDRSHLARDMAAVTAALDKVESLQSEVLLRLWEHTGASGGASTGSAVGPAGQQEQGSLVAALAAAAGSEQQEQEQEQEQEQQEWQEEQTPRREGTTAAPTAAAQPGRLASFPISEEEEEERESSGVEDALPGLTSDTSESEEEEAGPLSGPEGDEGLPGHLVRCFLQYLIDRNHGATRNVPPPGLSDPSVLVSAYWATARLARRQLELAHGRPLARADDPYWDEACLGGTLSHLAREHPPPRGDRAPLRVPPSVRHAAWDAGGLPPSPQLRRPGQPLLESWLWDRLLVLHHLGVAPALRELFGHVHSLEQAMATLAALSERQGASASARLAADCKREVVSSLRHHGWHQGWLLSPWKQEAAMSVAVTACRVMEAAAEQREGLLRYVPELYLETTLDMLHAVRRAEPSVVADGLANRGLDIVIGLVVGHLTDRRIINPDTRGILLQAGWSMWVMLQEQDCLDVVAANPLARARLMPSLMELVGEQRFWVQVVNVLLVVVEGTGFLQPAPGAAARSAAGPLAALRHLLPATCAADPGRCGEYFTHVFGYANWALTELVVALDEVQSTAAPRRGLDLGGSSAAAHALRRASVTGELCISLLRVLEFTADQLPGRFLAGPPLNMTRLSELVSFALPAVLRAGTAAALRRLASSAAAAGGPRLGQADLLRPLSGVLVALWLAEEGRAAQEQEGEEQQGQQGQQKEGPAQPEWKVEHSLVQAVAGLEAVTVAHLEALEAMDWGPEAAKPAGREQVAQLRGLLGAVRAARAAAVAARAGAEAGGAGAEEPPAEFLDPIMCTLMQARGAEWRSDPVVLPDSRVTIDRPTIERHLLTSATDPFSRAPLAAEQLLPDDALLAQIQAWLARQRAGAGPPCAAGAEAAGADAAGAEGREEHGAAEAAAEAVASDSSSS
eukprot:scaffold5.g718.t1